jgi:hypothetical protein
MFSLILIILSIISLIIGLFFVRPDSNKKTRYLFITALIVMSVVFIFIFNYDNDTIRLGKGIFYDKINKHILCSYATDIPPYVIAYDYDRNYIIVKQRPQYKEYVIYDRINYPLGKNYTYYWIIIKRNKKVIGPLSYEDFIKKKQIYNVPDKLKFKNRICNH